MMKFKGQNENDDGMLEFLEDIIGSNRFKEFIEILVKRVEILNEFRGEKVQMILFYYLDFFYCKFCLIDVVVQVQMIIIY